MPHCPLRDMVKFRKSAVNAGSRDQLASSYRRHILGRRFLLYLGLRLEMAMTKSVGPRPEPCSILALMVQRGEIAEGKKFLSTIGGMGSVVSCPIGVWGGAPETDAILSIWYQMECILGSCLPHNFQKLEGTVPIFSKVGGTRPRPSQPVRKLGGRVPRVP